MLLGRTSLRRARLDVLSRRTGKFSLVPFRSIQSDTNTATTKDGIRTTSIRNYTTFQPGYKCPTLPYKCHQKQQRHLPQRTASCFSTVSSSSTSTTKATTEIPTTNEPTWNEDMSTSELVAIIKEYCQQQRNDDDHYESQQIFEILQLRNDITQQELTSIAMELFKCWMIYQKQSLQILEESITNQDISKIILSKLENVCNATNTACEILEKYNTSLLQDEYMILLQAYANTLQVMRKANLPRRFTTATRGIPQRMQHLIQTKQQQINNTGVSSSSSSIENEEEDTSSSHNIPTEYYNEILRAWACSDEHLRGTMAEQLFQHQVTTPNGTTYRWIINAWCWSQERRCAFTATGHYMRRLRLFEQQQKQQQVQDHHHDIDDDMEMTLDGYHVLFHAWTKAEDKYAPTKVYTVLQLMEDMNKKELTNVRPDMQCYRDALITISRRVNVSEVGKLTDQILLSMENCSIVPDSKCYSSAILAWKNVTTNRDCSDRDYAAKRCFQLLREMTLAYHRTTSFVVKPQLKDYNHVLEALPMMSDASKATDTAEMLLHAMEESTNQEDEDDILLEEENELDHEHGTNSTSLRPNAETYKLVLSVWRKSRSFEKVTRARRLLQKFLQNYDDIVRYYEEDESSYVEVFNAFIRVCAYPKSSTSSGFEQMKIMKLALQSADETSRIGLQPNTGTYHALLEACCKLIPEGTDRVRMVEQTFRKCCDEGYVDQQLLAAFQALAPPYLYTKLVVAHSQDVEGMQVVPDSWTRNINEFRVRTKQGRKVLPLTIDGKFTMTIGAKEHKMRKLRRRINQRMLRGGRM